MFADLAFPPSDLRDTDKQTSKSSTAPYSIDDAHRLVQTLKEISIEGYRGIARGIILKVGKEMFKLATGNQTPLSLQ